MANRISANLSCVLHGLVLLLAAWQASAASHDAVRWDANLRHYVDGQGRVRIFHGMNVVYKETPWLPPTDGDFDPQSSLTARDMDLLQSWGFNAVRLGVMWPGVEPEHKKISQAYLQAAAKIVDELGERGVYTIVDLHQDLLSRRFCGEGIPEYYMDELLADPSSRVARAMAFPAPLKGVPSGFINSSGFPSIEDCLKRPFQDYYGTYQVGALWQTLYDSGSSLNAGFRRFWSAVATKFKGVDHVLGYELLNEPSGWCIEGSCSSLPKLTPEIERKFLAPLYQAAASQIRQADPDHIIYYESTVFPKVTSPFAEAVLGNDTQQGLAYHVYCEPGDDAGPIAGLECKAAQSLFKHEFYGFLDKFPVAGFMTEFGAIADTKGQLHHLNRLLDFADDKFQSWTYWMLKQFHDFTTANNAESLYGPDGKLEVAKLRTLSRTYAQAVAGVPEHMHFDSDTAAFELDFNSSDVKAPTEIYLNEDIHYPNGYSVSVSPPACVTSEHPKNQLLLHPQGGACVGQIVSLRLVAKAAKAKAEVFV